MLSCFRFNTRGSIQRHQLATKLKANDEKTAGTIHEELNHFVSFG